MKTKAEIVQRLLEEKHIDAEEAVILLMTEVIFTDYHPDRHPLPSSPYLPPYNPIVHWK